MGDGPTSRLQVNGAPPLALASSLREASPLLLEASPSPSFPPPPLVPLEASPLPSFPLLAPLVPLLAPLDACPSASPPLAPVLPLAGEPLAPSLSFAPPELAVPELPLDTAVLAPALPEEALDPLTDALPELAPVALGAAA